MHCFLPGQQLGCYSFPKSSGINWARGLLPGLGITHTMEPSWGFSQGNAAKRFKHAGHCRVCKIEKCVHEHLKLNIRHCQAGQGELREEW